MVEIKTRDIMVSFLALRSIINMPITIPTEPPSNEAIVRAVSIFLDSLFLYRWVFIAKRMKPIILMAVK